MTIMKQAAAAAAAVMMHCVSWARGATAAAAARACHALALPAKNSQRAWLQPVSLRGSPVALPRGAVHDLWWCMAAIAAVAGVAAVAAAGVEDGESVRTLVCQPGAVRRVLRRETAAPSPPRTWSSNRLSCLSYNTCHTPLCERSIAAPSGAVVVEARVQLCESSPVWIACCLCARMMADCG
jgi:hypothetical protein